jgi:hypothetical protein
MPVSIRKEGKARMIALQILGPPPNGLADSFGKKKRYVKKKEKKNVEGEGVNRYEEVGYR